MAEYKVSQDMRMAEQTPKPTVKRGLSQLSPRTQRIIRYSIIILCVFGFFFQTTLLFIQYFKGQTVVNIRVERDKYNSIPAITICYPAMVSMERTAQKYPQMKPLFDEYKVMLKHMSEDDYKNKTLGQHLNSIYENFSMFTYDHANINELFDLSIPFNLPRIENPSNYSNPEIPITISVWGMRLYSNGSVQQIGLMDTTPVESIRYSDSFSSDSKCFTFFSYLNETFREISIDLQWILLSVRIIDQAKR